MTFDKVKKLLSEQLDVDQEKITMESSISEDLGADSLDVVELLMSIEDNFGIAVPDEEATNLKTVGDVVKYIDTNS